MLLQDSQERAAAAAVAAAAAAQGKSGPQIVTETRRFAGKDILVCSSFIHHAAPIGLVSGSGPKQTNNP